MCDRGGWELFSTKSFAANAGVITLPGRQSSFWQPGVRTPPPVSTKRALSGLKTRNCASRARTHTRRPVDAATTCALHQPGCIGNFPVAGTAEASARASHRGVNLWRIARSRNVADATTPRDRHLWARAARLRGRNSTCQASPATAHCLCTAPAAQQAWCSSSTCENLATQNPGCPPQGAVPRCVRRARRAGIPSAQRDPSPRAAFTLPRAPDAARWGEKQKCEEKRDFGVSGS